MAKYGVKDTDLASIADAIRAKSGSAEPIVFPNGFKKSVDGIQTSKSLLHKTITEYSDDTLANVTAYAFYMCQSLVSVDLPVAKGISSYAFYGCGSLTSISFNGTTEQWKNISKGENWNLSTGEYTVYCTNGTITK